MMPGENIKSMALVVIVKVKQVYTNISPLLIGTQ